MDITKQLAQELSLRETQVRQTIALLDEGNTIPFIARYRKEATGELDEVQIRTLAERLEYLRNLETRKEEVIRLIGEQGKLTPALEQAVRSAAALQEVEDIYQPFRPKRRTRASVARAKGLEPLAELLLKQGAADPLALAADFLSAEVPSPQEALQGAQDIIAEHITDQPEIRQFVRKFTYDTGTIHSALAVNPEEDGSAKEFQMYWDYAEEVRKMPPHRILAINRGERLGVLQVKIGLDDGAVVERIGDGDYLQSPAAPIIEELRLMDTGACCPSIERISADAYGSEAHAIQISGQTSAAY